MFLLTIEPKTRRHRLNELCNPTQYLLRQIYPCPTCQLWPGSFPQRIPPKLPTGSPRRVSRNFLDHGFFFVLKFREIRANSLRIPISGLFRVLGNKVDTLGYPDVNCLWFSMFAMFVLYHCLGVFAVQCWSAWVIARPRFGADSSSGKRDFLCSRTV